MRVLYDSQAFDMQTHGGVSRYFSEIIKMLPSVCDYDLSVLESNNEYLSQFHYPQIGELYERFIVKGEFPCKGRLFDLYYNKIKKYHYGYNQNKFYSIKQLQQGNFDIFHPTFFDDYFLPYLNRKPFVLTIHDMIPEKFPELFDANDFQITKRRKLVPLASAIIAVSEQTKNDIIEILDVPEEKIHVIHHGAPSSFISNEVNKRVFPFEYLLYVGGRFGYKNFNRFVEEVSVFIRKHSDIKVVCTGTPFSSEEINFLKQKGVVDNFIHHYVKDDVELYSLYNNALAFIYPSIYEGFGIPILEAFNAECPVLLNNTSCFPEVAGDSALYFNLNDSPNSDLVDKLETIYNWSDKERYEHIAKQNQRLSMFSWEKSALQHVDVYEKVLYS